VLRGIVAITAVHVDGPEVLLGLCGPSQIPVGHPQDICGIQLVAHTDTFVVEPLAEQFGQSRAEGTLIDVRITHGQLAAAIGATRSMVTHKLADLREREQDAHHLDARSPSWVITTLA